MTNFIEIGGLIKKGLGHSVVDRFSKNIDVISIGYANGRSSDLFDIQQFGDASEAEILTMIVKERKSNSIFNKYSPRAVDCAMFYRTKLIGFIMIVINMI